MNQIDPVTQKHIDDTIERTAKKCQEMEDLILEGPDSGIASNPDLPTSQLMVYIIHLYTGTRWLADSVWTNAGLAMERLDEIRTDPDTPVSYIQAMRVSV